MKIVRSVAAVMAIGVCLGYGLMAEEFASPGVDSRPGMKPHRIGLVYGGALPSFDLQVPDTRIEVASDTAGKLCPAWVQALEEHRVCTEEGKWIVVASMAWTPVAVTIGAFHGAVTAPSAKRITGSSLVLENAVSELRVADGLRSQLMFMLWRRNPNGLTILTNTFPPESEFRVPTVMDRDCPVPFSYAARHQDLSRPLVAQGMDKLVMLRVIHHGLSGKDGHNSALSVNMAVRATIIRAIDATQLESFCARYDGPSRKFKDWAANNGQPFRDEFERALQKIAEEIFARIPATPPSQGGTVDAMSALTN